MANNDFQNGFALGVAAKGKVLQNTYPINVTFQVPNGTSPETYTEHTKVGIKANGKIAEPTEPTISGKIFQSWKDGNTTITFPYSPNEDKTLTASLIDGYYVVRDKTPLSTYTIIGHASYVTHSYENGVFSSYSPSTINAYSELTFSCNNTKCSKIVGEFDYTSTGSPEYGNLIFTAVYEDNTNSEVRKYTPNFSGTIEVDLDSNKNLSYVKVTINGYHQTSTTIKNVYVIE